MKYLRIGPNWRLIATGTLVVRLAGTWAMADTFNERKEELQQKIAQCFHHGIPSDNLKDLSESDVILLIELSEDPTNARCRYNISVGMSHIKSEEVHRYLERFNIQHLFNMIRPINTHEQMWLEGAVRIIPRCIGPIGSIWINIQF